MFHSDSFISHSFRFWTLSPRFCYCCPFGGEGDSIYHWTPSERFQKKRRWKRKGWGGPSQVFIFPECVCFCCLKFSLVAVNKVFLCGAGAGARRHSVCTGSSCSQVQNPQTHSKRTRSAFALQHKKRITADELQPLAGVDKCVVCFDGGWLNGAFNYPNTHVALVSGWNGQFQSTVCTCECNFHLSCVFPQDFTKILCYYFWT